MKTGEGAWAGASLRMDSKAVERRRIERSGRVRSMIAGSKGDSEREQENLGIWSEHLVRASTGKVF